MYHKTFQDLNGVAETLLVPLYMRAMESQRPDALINDPNAVELIRRLKCDLSDFEFHEDDQAVLSLRSRQFDRFVRRVLDRWRQAVVVHIGCGLDSRFDRVAERGVEWYDLDLPEVIELRRTLLGTDRGSYHLLSGSVLDEAWMEVVGAASDRPFLFVAEGVLQYFDETQVKSLVLTLQKRFPDGELILDMITPSVLAQTNAKYESTGIPRVRWAMNSSKGLEEWSTGIVMVNDWFYLDQPEPRLHALRRLAESNPLMAKGAGIVHYRLGRLRE